MRCDGMLVIQSNKMVMYSDDTETCNAALCEARMLDMARLCFFFGGSPHTDEGHGRCRFGRPESADLKTPCTHGCARRYLTV